MVNTFSNVYPIIYTHCFHIFRHQSYVGHVTWLSFDYVSSGRRKVLLATEGGVIAAVNAGPGTIGE